MKQILQNLRRGDTVLADVPAPVLVSGHVLVRTCRTLVSLGTEKSLVQFGKASLFQKARSQPERVKQVLAKMRTDGIMPTVEAVFRRLDEPLPLGYCNVGQVVSVGEGVIGFAAGDRVASNGPHAEFVSVPANLCAKIPDGVSDEAAAFTVVGAIGLEGVRLVRPELGETVVVIGLGLIGQITAQLLRAAGCRVIGFDFDHAKVGLADRFGVIGVASGGEVDPVRFVLDATGGLGADAVIITASTSSNDVISQAARMSRKRGRLVLVGVVGLQLNRADFYEKELTFQVSCSYGPGRYDDVYEAKGYDYPPGYVRWTENRNFQAVLEAMRTGTLKVEALVSRRVPLERYHEIYDNIGSGDLGSLLVYEVPVERSQSSVTRSLVVTENTRVPGDSGKMAAAESTIRVCDRKFIPGDTPLAIVGAGNFTKMTVLPALVEAKAAVKTIVSASGVTGTSLARKYEIPLSSTNFDSVLNDSDIRGVIITTRHNLHAAQVVAALRAGKHVLVEKPLCLSLVELREIEVVVQSIASIDNETQVANNRPTLTVGFNRRFSAHMRKARELLGASSTPRSLVATMNAGALPLNHWVHDHEIGGGRLVGEACHFVDLAVCITGSLVTAVCATGLGGGGAPAGDTASIMLRHANGSTSVVNYFGNGNRAYPKERVEVFAQERVIVIDDFRETAGYGFRGFTRLKTRPDKGHAVQFAEFVQCVRNGGPPLIPWPEVANVTRATLAIGESLRGNSWVSV